MLRVSKLTDYATGVMATLAGEPDAVLNASELSRRTHVNEPTVRKTLKLLAAQGLLRSIRGAHGGYRLARPASEISVADIITAIEGPVALTECANSGGHCLIEGHCGVRRHWQVINAAVSQTLTRLSLSDMASPLSPRKFAA